ncbi:MAG: 30S ribosomal protein THX [Gemmatimonadales bacterium]
MGKGDIRTGRGKIFRGTHGKTRSRKKEKEKQKRRKAAATRAAAGGRPT